MQVAGLDSNWDISPWSTASNPTYSWPPQCRIVILIASARLQGFSFLSLSWKHPRIVFCVTNRQTPIFFWTRSFGPTRQILLCCSGTPEIQSRLFVCCCPSILFDRWVLCRLLFLWWKPAAIVQIHFVKGFEGQKKRKNRWSLSSLENTRNSTLKKKKYLLFFCDSFEKKPDSDRLRTGAQSKALFVILQLHWSYVHLRRKNSCCNAKTDIFFLQYSEWCICSWNCAWVLI